MSRNMLPQPFKRDFLWILDRLLFICCYDFFLWLAKFRISLQPSNNGVQNRNNIFNARYGWRLIIIRNTFIEYLLYVSRIFILPYEIIEKINYFNNKSPKAGFVLRVNMVMMNHIGTCWRCKPRHDSSKFGAIPFNFFDKIFSRHLLFWKPNIY